MFCTARGVDFDDLVRLSLTTLLRSNKYFDLGDKVTFGKFQGETIETVIRIAPGYVEWALNTIEGMTLSPRALDLLMSISAPDEVPLTRDWDEDPNG
jgi:hypothetical protein